MFKKYYLQVVIITFGLFIINHCAKAQSALDAPLYHIGIEVQWYPAGYQFMLTGEWGFTQRDAIHAKLGYNLARRQDFSPYNDQENGGGWGFTTGYRHYFQDQCRGLYVGGRMDWWWLTIDWEDDLETANPTAGSTDIVVFQPTGEVGYLYQQPNSPWAVGVNAAAGWEINVLTDGEEVGQGAIGLLGARLRYLIND